MLLGSEIEDLEIRFVIDAIHQRYGYDFREYESGSIHRRVRSALAKTNFAHLGDLQHALLTSPEFFVSLLDDLTVQVSELFRDPEMYARFRREVCPILRTYPQLKLWHAGCASGEEIYTTAIILEEEGLYERSQIYATDVSVGALARARDGVYSASAAMCASEGYQRAGGTRSLSDYYSCGYGSVAMRESLKRNVFFFQHDLVSDFTFGEMHVIFCRNVVLYFGRQLRERVVGKLGQSLCRGGFLVLGASECLPEAIRPLLSEHAPERIYRRRGAT
jgi:chemotaxis protein methyltransferase CheR